MFVFIEDSNKNSKFKSLFWGGVLVLIGIFFLLKNMEIIDFDIPDYILNWRIIFVIFTINALISQKWNSAILWGGLSLILYAPILFDVQPLQLKFLWPIIIIAIGLFIIGKVRSNNSR